MKLEARTRIVCMRGRVVVVGMLDSVHVARWLSQFEREEIDFFLFPSSPHRRVHKSIQALLAGRSVASFRTMKPLWLFGAPAWMADRLLDNRFRAMVLKFVIKAFRPQVLHALELQNAGYLVERCIGSAENDFPGMRLILTNYGSDIFWFSRFPKHREKLSRLLALADAYSCECERDVRLAKELGFSGQVMPVFPNAGGFSSQDLGVTPIDLDTRKTIAIKGYEGWVGRAITALEGVESIAASLHGYKIELYSCNYVTIRKARNLRKRTGLDIHFWAKGKLSHPEMLELFRRSIVYVGISESDGISTSLLEAMAFGAIPVQTSSSCCNEWFSSSGVSVSEISPQVIGGAILQAIDLAQDPNNALTNRQTILEKASEDKVKAAALQYYR